MRFTVHGRIENTQPDGWATFTSEQQDAWLEDHRLRECYIEIEGDFREQFSVWEDGTNVCQKQLVFSDGTILAFVFPLEPEPDGCCRLDCVVRGRALSHMVPARIHERTCVAHFDGEVVYVARFADGEDFNACEDLKLAPVPVATHD